MESAGANELKMGQGTCNNIRTHSIIDQTLLGDMRGCTRTCSKEPVKSLIYAVQHSADMSSSVECKWCRRLLSVELCSPSFNSLLDMVKSDTFGDTFGGW